MLSIAGHQEFSEVFAEGKDISFVYYGDELIWQKVRSCYGNGFWVNTLPWLNDDCWRNE